MENDALALEFRKRFVRGLKLLYKKGLLEMPFVRPGATEITTQAEFNKRLDQIALKPWVADAKRTPKHLRTEISLLKYGRVRSPVHVAYRPTRCSSGSLRRDFSWKGTQAEARPMPPTPNRVQRKKRHPLLFVSGGQFDTGITTANDGTDARRNRRKTNRRKTNRSRTNRSRRSRSKQKRISPSVRAATRPRWHRLAFKIRRQHEP